MRRKLQLLTGALAVLVLAAVSASAQAVASNEGEDTETRLIDAKVVEVAENHISVIARTGVEHVIEINNERTKVTIEGEEVSLKHVREGDVITIELDEQNPIMFAKNITFSASAEQVAKVRR